MFYLQVEVSSAVGNVDGNNCDLEDLSFALSESVRIGEDLGSSWNPESNLESNE